MIAFAIYLLIGATAGTFAGLLGIGGGIIAIPLLAYTYANQGIAPTLVMHMAAGTSMAAMILTSSSSMLGHLRHGTEIRPIYQRLFLGIILGTIIGAVFGRFLSGQILEIIFAVFILYVASRMIVGIKSKPSRKLPPNPWVFLISFIIGAKSGLLGIGGGSIMMPFLIYCNVPTRKAITTTAASTFTIAIIGTLSYMIAGMHLPHTPRWSTGYIYWPGVLGVALTSTIFAQIGAHFSYKVPTKQLKKILGIVLLIMAVKMFI